MSKQKYVVVREECIMYRKEYDKKELIEMGFPPDLFDADDHALPEAFKYALDWSLQTVLDDDTEPHGDVQYNQYMLARVK